MQRHAIQGQAFGVGRNADRLGAFADQIGQADIVDLGDFDLQLARDPGQVVGGDAVNTGLRRQGQGDNRHIINATANDQRFANANRDAVHIGADLFMRAQDGAVRAGANQEPRGDHGIIIAGRGIDMFDVIDALHDGFHRLGHQFHGVIRPKAGRLNVDVHQGNRDLRLFFSGQGNQRDQTHGQGRQDHQGRQGRLDETAGQAAGNTQFAAVKVVVMFTHGPCLRHRHGRGRDRRGRDSQERPCRPRSAR